MLCTLDNSFDKNSRRKNASVKNCTCRAKIMMHYSTIKRRIQRKIEVAFLYDRREFVVSVCGVSVLECVSEGYVVCFLQCFEKV